MLRRFALPLILLLALALRLINISGHTLWYDEAFAVLFSEKGLDAMLYGTLTPVAGGAADIHPLLYYMTLDGWMALFGQSPAVVRLWSVLLGVATVGVMCLLGRDLFGRNTGLAAAFITAVMPFHVQYSQEVRMYSLLALLLMLCTWCFVRGMNSLTQRDRDAEGQEDKSISQGHKGTRVQGKDSNIFLLRSSELFWWVGFGVLAALAMYTQQLAAFYLVALGLVPTIMLARRARYALPLLKRVVFGAGIAIVLYLPWLVNLPGQFAKVQSYYWVGKPPLLRPLLTIRSFLSFNGDIPDHMAIYTLVGAVFVIAFLLIQTVIYLRRRRSQPDRGALLLTLWLAAGPVALMWLVSQIQPVYLERSLIGSALMLYLALAWLFTRSGTPRPILAIIGVVAAATAAIGLYYQYTWDTFPNSPFGYVAAAIRSDWQEGDVVVHQTKLSALPMIYYERDLTQRYLADAAGSSEDTLALPTQQSLGLLADECIQTAARDAQRVWLVTFDFAEEQYAAAGRLDEYQAPSNWLEEHYSQTESQNFNDLVVTRYDQPRNEADLETNCDEQ